MGVGLWTMEVMMTAMVVSWGLGVEGFDPLESKRVIGLREVRLGTGSVLQALLDSQYSEMVLYLDKADMLEELEREVLRRGAITVFAPKNSYLEQQVDADLWRFLMRPGHEAYLRTLLKHHVIPGRVEGADFQNRTVETLASGNVVGLRSHGLKRKVSRKSRSGTKSASTTRYMLEKNAPVVPDALLRAVMPPTTSVTAPSLGPSLGPSIAPAPGPGIAGFTWDDDEETLQFVMALTNYGGYNDMAELLVNATTLGIEIGKLARMGYKITILAPNDQAMQQLTIEQLDMPMEPLLYYHFLSEYQTDESMYNAVKRLGKQSYSTLRHPHKVIASESDGTVKFGDGDGAAHICDHDIYVEGHISVQGINRVLSPPP
uniref:FAS1 domain-containing protein n=1 Tax=Physcomitrium patens TaxID=3218 RepID=A0A2K1IDY3_PHYPA|nr:hypothetical protein PHYPA_029641 [Physcomitrium patens]